MGEENYCRRCYLMTDSSTFSSSLPPSDTTTTHLDDTSAHYSAIENYGIIGAMRTCALISKKNGSIDFMCYPNFDSPSLFCRLLDYAKGGFWEISVSEEYSPDTKTWNNLNPCMRKAFQGSGSGLKQKQIYLPNSNILVTRYHATATISQVVDLMPVIPEHLQLFVKKPFTNDSNMAFTKADISGDAIPVPWIVRKFEAIRGKIRMKMVCRPHFNYARSGHRIIRDVPKSSSVGNAYDSFGVKFVCEQREICMELSWACNSWSSCSMINCQIMDEASGWPGVITEFELEEGCVLIFVFRQVPYKKTDIENPSPCFKLMQNISFDFSSLDALIASTNLYWHSWVKKCKYDGNFRHWVYRSALLLKLMTYYPTGAIIAAPTFSVPEEIGGKLNWDYRFTWIRDASFTIYAFIRLGLKEEANAFMRWIEERCQEMFTNGLDLAVLYDIRGDGPERLVQEYHETDPMENGSICTTANDREASSSIYETSTAHETLLCHLDGYCGSKPVRIGNGAVHQLQLDIYGELLDSIYLIDKYCQQISFDFWVFIKNFLIPIVMKRWREPDYSIWEFRHGKQHYTYSKIMCWVALDRALRLANKHSFPAPNRLEWQRVRDEIYLDVMDNGYDSTRRVFTQYYGSAELDASILIMPLVFFMPANDPRFLNTLDALMQKPQKGGLTINHLCFRTSFLNTTQEDASMKDSDYLKNEGTFNLCTFWLIEALCRTSDVEHLKTAELMFEGITSFANHLGLFSEELNVSGKATGNFPQAFTHLSLISAAICMDRASARLGD